MREVEYFHFRDMTAQNCRQPSAFQLGCRMESEFQSIGWKITSLPLTIHSIRATFRLYIAATWHVNHGNCQKRPHTHTLRPNISERSLSVEAAVRVLVGDGVGVCVVEVAEEPAAGAEGGRAAVVAGAAAAGRAPGEGADGADPGGAEGAVLGAGDDVAAGAARGGAAASPAAEDAPEGPRGSRRHGHQGQQHSDTQLHRDLSERIVSLMV